MKINKLRLKNFRSYEDEIEFDFTTESNENIILIGGENGAGKSSIFEAIKLCVYGSLAYKYQGMNSSYIQKIKSSINYNAYKMDSIDAFVELDIELEDHTEIDIYSLRRSWTFKNKKLEENFIVHKNYCNNPLSNEEMNFFQNYLKSIIPPKIFEFFFFDGEQISDFFIGKNSNKHLKDALLALCNYDTFDILKKFTLSNSMKNKSSGSEMEKYKLKYYISEKKLIELKEQNSQLIEKIENEINKDLEELDIKKIALDEKFRKRGGILSEERENLNRGIFSLEKRREEINQYINKFCNEMLPFLILKKALPKLENQVNKETEYQLFENISKKINYDFLYNMLREKIEKINCEEIAGVVHKALLDELNPNISDNFKVIHDLSPTETSNVLSNIELVNNFNSKSILNLYTETRDIASKIKVMRKVLDSSIEEKELNDYLSQINDINSEIIQKIEEKNKLQDDINKKTEDILNEEVQREKHKKTYLQLAQAGNIVDISASIIDMLNELIVSLTQSKLEQVEENFIEVFSKIIRKDNYIDSIRIDNGFNVTLYKKKVYNTLELENLIENIGFEEMNKKYGELFIEDLYKIYNVNKNIDLIRSLKISTSGEMIELRSKVDINGFSKGEKQIYVLCLYWALIKSSNIKIPFIIDTPYARIDQKHRNNITSQFFSTISEQVIILSTNTEIDVKAYKKLKHLINKEYLLKYDAENTKTKMFEKYFFEV